MSRRGHKRQRQPRMLSLFSGIGGIDLAWEMAGGEIAGQVEIDPFCQQVLARHWPDVKRVGDIRSVWGDTFDDGRGAIDLVAGGFPCQPFSVAGQRRGREDDRFLWPEMRRVIDIYQPAWVLGENVSGFIGLALDDVCADLERAGYEVGTLVLPAAAVGAPHQRERVFIIGHLADANQHSGRRAQRAERGDVDGATGAHAAREGHLQRHPDQCGGEDVEYTSGAGRQECHPTRVAGDTGHTARRSAQDGRDRQAQPTLGGGVDGLSRRLDGVARDSDEVYPYQPWPAGSGQAQHEWEPPRTTGERIPNRAARLKALGNAVVPAQVYPLLAAIIAQWRDEQREERAG